MKALILVGGQGTRLLPLTCKTPKAMVPILNRPFLEHLLAYLKRHGINEVILALGYLPDPIQRGLADGDRHGIKLIYSVETTPLGTAGAVKYAEKYLNDEPFFVFNGDVITEIDLTEMLAKHRQIKPEVSIALTPVDNPSAYGVVETDEKGMIKRFIEKPPRGTEPSNMINAGIYILEPEVLDMIPENKFFMFETDVFPPLLKQDRKILGYSSNAYWIDIGTPGKYLKVQYDLLNKNGKNIIIQGKCKIHQEARIEGPVLIGPGCKIEKSLIIGPTVLGAGCTVGNNVKIEKSILWPGNAVASEAVLKECIIDSNCTIGEKCEIFEESVIGDNVTLGSGSRVSPGSRIWPDQTIPPRSTLSGNVGKPT